MPALREDPELNRTEVWGAHPISTSTSLAVDVAGGVAPMIGVVLHVRLQVVREPGEAPQMVGEENEAKQVEIAFDLEDVAALVSGLQYELVQARLRNLTGGIG
jgi:hypothetical protein